MKFQIGEHVFLWQDNGEGIYDGTRLEVIGWRYSGSEIQYRCDNLSSDLPVWIQEDFLLSTREWQGIAQRMINGDLYNCRLAKEDRNPKYRWYFRTYRRQYATKELE